MTKKSHSKCFGVNRIQRFESTDFPATSQFSKQIDASACCHLSTALSLQTENTAL